MSRERLLPGERPPPRSPAVLPLDPRFFPTPPSHSGPGPLKPFPWLGLCVVSPELQTSSPGAAPLGQALTVPEHVLAQQGRGVWPGPSRLLTAVTLPRTQRSLQLSSRLWKWMAWVQISPLLTPGQTGHVTMASLVVALSQFYHLEKRRWSSPAVAWYGGVD